jgi:hypothetical protein
MVDIIHRIGIKSPTVKFIKLYQQKTVWLIGGQRRLKAMTRSEERSNSVFDQRREN